MILGSEKYYGCKKIKSWRESTLPCDCHVIENAVKFKMSDSEDNVLNVCTKKARMSLTVNADGSGDDQVIKVAEITRQLISQPKCIFVICGHRTTGVCSREKKI